MLFTSCVALSVYDVVWCLLCSMWLYVYVVTDCENNNIWDNKGCLSICLSIYGKSLHSLWQRAVKTLMFVDLSDQYLIKHKTQQELKCKCVATNGQITDESTLSWHVVTWGSKHLAVAYSSEQGTSNRLQAWLLALFRLFLV